MKFKNTKRQLNVTQSAAPGECSHSFQKETKHKATKMLSFYAELAYTDSSVLLTVSDFRYRQKGKY